MIHQLKILLNNNQELSRPSFCSLTLTGGCIRCNSHIPRRKEVTVFSLACVSLSSAVSPWRKAQGGVVTDSRLAHLQCLLRLFPLIHGAPMLLCSCIQFMRNTNPSFPRNKSKLSSSSSGEIKGQLSSPHVLANMCWKVKTSALNTLTAAEGEEKLATVSALICKVKDGRNSPYFILQTAGMRSFCLGCGLACLRPWLCPSGKSALSSGYIS